MFLTPAARKFRLNRIRIIFMRSIMKVMHLSSKGYFLGGFNGLNEAAPIVKALFDAAYPIRDSRRISSDSSKTYHMEGDFFRAAYSEVTHAGFFSLCVPEIGEKYGTMVTLMTRDGYLWIETSKHEQGAFFVDSFSKRIHDNSFGNIADYAKVSGLHPNPKRGEEAAERLLALVVDLIGKAGTLEKLEEMYQQSRAAIEDDFSSLHEGIAETYFEPDAPRITPQQLERERTLERREADDVEYAELIIRFANK